MTTYIALSRSAEDKLHGVGSIGYGMVPTNRLEELKETLLTGGVELIGTAQSQEELDAMVDEHLTKGLLAYVRGIRDGTITVPAWDVVKKMKEHRRMIIFHPNGLPIMVDLRWYALFIELNKRVTLMRSRGFSPFKDMQPDGTYLDPETQRASNLFNAVNYRIPLVMLPTDEQLAMMPKEFLSSRPEDFELYGIRHQGVVDIISALQAEH